MTMSTDILPAVRTCFARLIDYAGLFPPAKLGVADAVAEYDEARSASHAWMLGRFIVPASRLAELAGAIGNRAPFAVSVIVDAVTDALRWFESARTTLSTIADARANTSLRIEALEVPLPVLGSMRETFGANIGQLAALAEQAGLRNLPIYAEMPRDQRWRGLLADSMTALARARFGAKIRCGGLTAEAFPSPEDVTAFIAASTAENVPFKGTAGLHHPVRHFNAPSGFTMHGFLNILAACALARRADEATLATILAEEDPAAFRFDERGFAWRDLRASVEEIAAMREHGFVAYGSCSFAEPIDDLTALGILPKTN